MKFDTKFLEDLSVSLNQTAKDLGSKAERLYGKQKLRGQMLMEERSLEKALAELGRVVYKRYAEGEEVDDDLRVFCENVDLYFEKLEKLKSEAAGKAGKKICPSCGKEMDQDAVFCGFCGSAYPKEETVQEPEKEEGNEEAVEKAADAAEETVEEVAEGMEEVSEGMEEVSEGMEEVSEGMEEVSEGMEEVADAMEEVREAMEEIAEGNADDAE